MARADGRLGASLGGGPDLVARMAQRLRDAPAEIVPVDTAMEVAARLLGRG